MLLPEFASPKPGPITKVSPSLANELLACQLRVAFSRDARFKAWRRPNTYTCLGEVAHAVTQAAFTHPFPDEEPTQVREQLEELWDAAVRRGAEALSVKWAPAAPPPPSEWPGYFLTRARTIRRASKLVGSRGAVKQSLPPGTGVEVDLEDPASGLFGRADRIERQGNAVRVVDLKTGLRQGEPTEGQRRQLLLYAVLVQRTTGQWPTEIAIEDASGAQTAMPLDAVAAESALSETLAAVELFNDRIAVGDQTADADPSADRCRWCAFRVACAPYWQALQSDWAHHSLLGEVIDSGESEHGGFARLALGSPPDTGSQVHISALPKAPDAESVWMALVDVIGDPASGDVRARWSTTIRSW